MTLNYFASYLFLTCLFNVFLMLFVWKKVKGTGMGSASVLSYLGAISLCTLAYGLMVMSPTLELQFFWLKLRYLGDQLLPPTIFFFIVWFIGRDSWLRGGRFIFFIIAPAVIYLIILTNDWHHLYYARVWLKEDGVLPILDKSVGPFYWANIIVTYLYIFSGLALLFREFLRLPGLFLRQFNVVLAGTLLPVLAHMAYLNGFRIGGILNPVYFGFSLTGLALTIGLFRFQLLELRPISRDIAMKKASIGIIVLDDRLRLLEMNPAVAHEFAISTPRLSHPLSETLPGLAAWLTGIMPVRQDLETEWKTVLENPAENSDKIQAGTTKPHTYRVKVTPIYSGHHLSGWLILLENITDQLEIQNKLRQNEGKLRFITDNAAAVLFMTDRSLGTTYVSSFVTRLLGYTTAEFMRLESVDYLSTESMARLQLNLEKAMQDFSSGWWQKYVDKIETLELEFIHRDGQHFWGEIQYTYLVGEDGDFEGLLGVARDISERRELHTQMIEQQRALVSLAEREQLARDLHDSLGQVMGTINVEAQTALIYLRQGQTDLAEAVLQNLSEMARSSHGDLRELLLGLRQKFSEAPDFYSALEKYLQEFTRVYNLPVNLSLPPAAQRRPLEPMVEVQLLRVIQEGISNIRRHARASSAAVLFSQNERETQIIIEDDGIGYDPQVVSTATAENGEGALPHYGQEIMRERLAAIGGSLRVVSAPGQGTHLFITIPQTPESGAPGSISNLRVLVADDHPLFRDGLRNLLTARGVKVVGTARDGQEAVQKTLELRPDVAILDIQMPVLDGVEAARQIKLEAPEVRVLMLTMAADDATLFKAIRAGASGYLLKDLKAEDFLERLEALMRGETPISPGLAEKLLHEFAGSPEPLEERLSDRQLEILHLMAERLTYAQIAQRLYLSESTVKYHAGQIMERLHAAGRNAALAEAARRGWIERRGPRRSA